MENFLNTTLRNIAWFKQVYEQHELEMKPPFQRNPVWVTRQKSFLIDTILNRYPIPEIYMQETADEYGHARYIIIDGQQRIRAVLEFLEEKYHIDEKESPEFNGAFFSDLTAEQKKNIFQYNFVVRILPDVNDSELRAIFQRLNKNVVALNKQELRQATYSGPFIKLMNELSDKEAFSQIRIFTANDVRRMLDVEYISELTIALLNGLQNKKTKLENYYQLYEEEFNDVEFVKEVYNTVLGELLKILPNIDETRWSKKTDFYSLFLVMARHYEKFPLSKEGREKARNILIEFGNQINKRTSTATQEKINYPDSVEEYVKGMRATTDLSSRKYRDTAIDKLLASLWN